MSVSHNELWIPIWKHYRRWLILAMASTWGMKFCFFLQVLQNSYKFQKTLEQRSPSNLNESEWDLHNITKLHINNFVGSWIPRALCPFYLGSPHKWGILSMSAIHCIIVTPITSHQSIKRALCNPSCVLDLDYQSWGQHEYFMLNQPCLTCPIPHNEVAYLPHVDYYILTWNLTVSICGASPFNKKGTSCLMEVMLCAPICSWFF